MLSQFLGFRPIPRPPIGNTRLHLGFAFCIDFDGGALVKREDDVAENRVVPKCVADDPTEGYVSEFWWLNGKFGVEDNLSTFAPDLVRDDDVVMDATRTTSQPRVHVDDVTLLS